MATRARSIDVPRMVGSSRPGRGDPADAESRECGGPDGDECRRGLELGDEDRQPSGERSELRVRPVAGKGRAVDEVRDRLVGGAEDREAAEVGPPLQPGHDADGAGVSEAHLGDGDPDPGGPVVPIGLDVGRVVRQWLVWSNEEVEEDGRLVGVPLRERLPQADGFVVGPRGDRVRPPAAGSIRERSERGVTERLKAEDGVRAMGGDPGDDPVELGQVLRPAPPAGADEVAVAIDWNPDGAEAQTEQRVEASVVETGADEVVRLAGRSEAEHARAT
jgi:hypothetical protein